MKKDVIDSDFLVIGSGVAGLFFSLLASRAGTVCLVTKSELWESSSFYAQGGIASVIDVGDSFEAHIQDTLNAGAGLCNPAVVETVVKEGPERIKELIKLGVKFTKRSPDEFDLAQEGGHSKRRILHAEDATGKEVERVLIAQVQKSLFIKVFEHHIALNLITGAKIGLGEKDEVIGAYVLDKKSGEVKIFKARATILATGGAGKLYIYTTNPDIATGDGIAMAYRAGAKIANMEFVQFHPTCLYHPQARNFLLSEALRGEGALLKSRDGTRFMTKYHPDAELAPRDIVARAIDQEMKQRGDDYVLLDISHRDADFIKKRFPTIYKTCKQFGYDITKEPVPVVPSAHYLCGGILTELNAKTNLQRLYAIGECACSGLHGANRLASNSLLEALVFAYRAFLNAKNEPPSSIPSEKIPAWEKGEAVPLKDYVELSHNLHILRRIMWDYVGIIRTDKRLELARQRIQLLQDEINQYYWDFIVNPNLIELRNIAQVANLVVESAIQRKESRGLHYNIDHPNQDPAFLKDTILQKSL